VRDKLVQAVLLQRLAQQLGHVAVEVGLHLAQALRLAAVGLPRMQERGVVDLREGLERHAQPVRVIEHAVVVVRDAPRAGVEVQAGVELAVLHGAAELGVGVAAAQRPRAAAGARVVLEHLHAVAGLAQLEGRDEARHARAEHQHRGALRRALQVDRARVRRFGGEAQRGHRLVHRGAAGGLADPAEEVAAGEGASGRGRCVHRRDRARGDRASICQDTRLAGRGSGRRRPGHHRLRDRRRRA
jgi:hypothetical protein